MWASPLIGLTLSLVLTPYVGRIMTAAGITGKDIHKPNPYDVPEMCGIAVLLSLPIALSPALDEKTAMAMLPFLLFGIVGVLDDTTNLRQLHKVILSLLVSIPAAFIAVPHTVNVFGLSLNLGMLYLPFAVLFVTGSANLVNLLAGFNGLEVGTAGIALFFLGLITGGTAQLIALTGAAVSLGFLWWNRYPARVFPGDTGTLALGALIGIVGIIGKVEAYAALLLIPHFLDFIIKTSVRFGVRKHGRTRVRADGTLQAPPYPSFLGLIMRSVRVTEPKLVAMVWSIETVLGLFSLALHL